MTLENRYDVTFPFGSGCILFSFVVAVVTVRCLFARAAMLNKNGKRQDIVALLPVSVRKCSVFHQCNFCYSFLINSFYQIEKYPFYS